MNKSQLSLRRRPVVKAPPPGVKLQTALPRSTALRLEEIVERMRPGDSPPSDSDRSVGPTLEQREAILARGEEGLVQREHALRIRETALIEREREALETIKLAEVREARAVEHEALLAEQGDDLERAATLTRLQKELADLNDERRKLQAALQQANADLDTLETELLEAKTTAEKASQAKASTEEGADDTTLFAERESFLEESENTLFHRAQELQELEMHLQQWQEELNAQATEMGLLDRAPHTLRLVEDPAQNEENLNGLQPRD